MKTFICYYCGSQFHNVAGCPLKGGSRSVRLARPVDEVTS